MQSKAFRFLFWCATLLTNVLMLATENVVEAYGGIRGIPTTFVIDKEGRIVDKFEGYRPMSEFKALIEKLIKEK